MLEDITNSVSADIFIEQPQLHEDTGENCIIPTMTSLHLQAPATAIIKRQNKMNSDGIEETADVFVSSAFFFVQRWPSARSICNMNTWFKISKFQTTQFLPHQYPKKNNITQKKTNNTSKS